MDASQDPGPTRPEPPDGLDPRLQDLRDFTELTQLEGQAIIAETAEAREDLERSGHRYAPSSRLEYLEERSAWLFTLILLVVIAMVVILWRPWAVGQAEAPTPSGEISVSVPTGPTGTVPEETHELSVSGPWRIYTDAGRQTPFIELTFQPDGPATWVMPFDGTGDLSVQSWSYRQEDGRVEVTLVLHMVDPAYGVDYTMDAWLHLTEQADGTLTGAYEQHVIGYETVGDTAGTLHDSGRSTILDGVVAEPAT